MRNRLLFCTVFLFVSAAIAAHDLAEGLLLHWQFDSQKGTVVKDRSRNNLDGKVEGRWERSPAGHALRMDGTPATVVSVQVPDDLRFGRESWTFMAMVKPKQFTIADPPNNRLIFSFGLFPTASLTIGIDGNGALLSYFSHGRKDGKPIAISGGTALPLILKRWAHIAVVCDRENREVRMYVNGYCSGPKKLDPAFDGDFTLGGLLTVGSKWHNYMGLIDEVRIYRRGLAAEEIEAVFKEQQAVFKIVESEATLTARRQAEIAGLSDKVFDKVTEAWAGKRWHEVVTLCRSILAAKDVPPHVHSYAYLRLAQCALTVKQNTHAIAFYRKLAERGDLPAVQNQLVRCRRHERPEVLCRVRADRDPCPALAQRAAGLRRNPI